MDFDLEPQEWRSERDKPKEPFFGPGLPSFIVLIVWVFAVCAFKRYVING